MSEAKFTSGPWYVGYAAKCCAVYFKPSSSGEWLVKNQVARFDRSEEGMANARLIAAAPDLYEALKGLLPYISDEMSAAEPAEERARAALAKASAP